MRSLRYVWINFLQTLMLVYVLDPAGRIAYATRGGVEAMVELVGRS